ncbi:MAG: energy-coupling factor transporter transmembrane component T [Clostridia bacterium]
MKDFTFGQYYPSGSIIHRLDARAKLVISLLYMIAVFFIKSYSVFAMSFVFLLSIILISKVPLRTVLKSVKAIFFLLLFTSLLNILFYHEGTVIWSWWVIKITWGGVHFAIKLTLRMSLLVMGMSLLTFTTTPTELTDGIESLLKPLTLIKVPTHDIALVMSIALRFIPGLIEETDKIMMAQKARGAELDTGGLIKKIKAMLPVIIPLFVSSFRKADELADALDARCYKASPHRQKMKVLKFGWRDAIALVVVLAVFVLILLDAYLVGGDIGIDKYVVALLRSWGMQC